MEKNIRQKNLTKLILGFVAGLFLLWGWLSLINIKALFGYIKNINLSWVLISLVCYFLAYIIRTLRWNVIINKIKNVPSKDVFISYWGGMLINYLIPLKTGEIIKALYIKKTSGIPTSRVLSTIFLDKFFDLCPVIFLPLLLPFIAFTFNYKILILFGLIYFLLLLFVAFLIFSIKHREQASNMLLKIGYLFPKNFKDKILQFITSFIDGLDLLSFRLAAGMILLTLISVSLEGMFIYLLFTAYGKPIAFAVALFGYTLQNLTYALPTPPGQIGSQELTWFIIFSATMGIDKNLSGAVIAFAHFCTGIIVYITGNISLSLMGITLWGSLNFNNQNLQNKDSANE